MKTGTKSLLFGVHQFMWHPLTVWLAWVWLYRRPPTFRETVCILIHDWGYWGKAKMDDEEGERHPELGAKIAGWLFGGKYYYFCLLHSRHYARNADRSPSRLCWADKMSHVLDPWWFYIPRAWASGELHEYRQIANDTGFLPIQESHRVWYRWLQERFRQIAESKRGDVIDYANPRR